MPAHTPASDPSPASATRALRVALLGCGVVGTQVARALLEHADDLAARAGAPLELVGVAVRDVTKPRDGVGTVIPADLLTEDAEVLVDEADLVVEVMGGIEPARTLIRRAIDGGASVVTANKALLAEQGPSLFEAADAAGVDLSFEAAVAGAIPIVRPVRESLAGDHVRRVLGIVNGTTNYVLDQMATHGLELAQAVKEAQELGYAEADPTADVEGLDAAAKAAILASLAFHTRVSIGQVAREGITSVTADDVAWAARTGHVVKLLAIAEQTDEGVSVRVHPALVPLDHPLAAVRGAFNAVFVEADGAGSLMFYGQGAGGRPTASAVLGDLVSAARDKLVGGKGPHESAYASLPVLPADAAVTRYQVRMVVADRPGVLAQVAGVLADHGVSIDTVRQTAGEPPADATGTGTASLLLTTHAAREASLAATVAALDGLEPVREITSVLRVEGV
ncbi:homoserine dehydrogenase [Isoptericola variabilis]|uniref:Homoserine dehydrogenase n=1 Tax=Isoptericola variabilis (strain 225) TaxID=743718 RepID=F6FRH7_ISOV2|nr:homoserine dehydrogenase [Isoptericola variabilis]AEG45035.1 homoserine dehydrogenase [Isoptericola variabilis 225]TWH26162.1 homoserine dehydrogenase [Isoptericola variabilis J7]